MKFSFNNKFQNTATEEAVPSCIKPTKYPGGSEGIGAAQRKESEEDSGAGQEKNKSTEKMAEAKNGVQARGGEESDNIPRLCVASSPQVLPSQSPGHVGTLPPTVNRILP